MTATIAVQLSDVVGALMVTAAEQSPRSLFTVVLAGQLMEGSSSSVMVTVIEQVPVFPASSVVVHTTVVVPTGYTSEASVVLLKSLLYVKVDEQLSVAVGWPTVASPVHTPKSLSSVTLVGQLATGSSVSLTVTVMEQVALFPAGSVTVHVTVVEPRL